MVWKEDRKTFGQCQRVALAKRLQLSLNPLWTLAKLPTERKGEKGEC